MACGFPGAENVQEFWRNLVAGSETISFFDSRELEPLPAEAEIRNDPHYVSARGVIAVPQHLTPHFSASIRAKRN